MSTLSRSTKPLKIVIRLSMKRVILFQLFLFWLTIVMCPLRRVKETQSKSGRVLLFSQDETIISARKGHPRLKAVVAKTVN